MEKKEYPYEYSSVQLGNFFGITVKGIEYYEKKGLISPQRIGTEKERRFNLKDTYRLFLSRYFKQADFSLKEIHNIFDQYDIATVSKIIEEKEKEIHKKELLIHAIDESMKHTSKLLKRISQINKPFFDVEIEVPDMKWLFVRNMNSPHIDDQQQLKEYKSWNELMPVTHGSLKYSKNDFLNNTELNPDIGMLISTENFKKFNFKESDRVISVNPKLYVHTVLIGDANEIKRDTWLMPIRQFIKDNNFRLSGDIITSFIFVKQNTRYDEAWIPIERSV